MKDASRIEAENAAVADFAKGERAAKDMAARGNLDTEKQAMAAVRVGLSRMMARSDQPINLADVGAGEKSLRQHFGSAAPEITAMAAGRRVEIDLPRFSHERNGGITPGFEQLVDAGRKVAASAALEAYQHRGRVDAMGSGGRYLEKVEPASLMVKKDDLVQHMLFIRSAIDKAEKEGKRSPREAELAKQYLEKDTFNLRGPVKEDARTALHGASDRLRQDVMERVRGREQDQLTQSAKRNWAEPSKSTATNSVKADVFLRSKNREKAVSSFPDLKHAYVLLDVAREKASERMSGKELDNFVARVQERISDDLRVGKPLPELQMREPARDKSVGVER